MGGKEVFVVAVVTVMKSSATGIGILHPTDLAIPVWERRQDSHEMFKSHEDKVPQRKRSLTVSTGSDIDVSRLCLTFPRPRPKFSKSNVTAVPQRSLEQGDRKNFPARTTEVR
jgi:hypothetical protein